MMAYYMGALKAAMYTIVDTVEDTAKAITQLGNFGYKIQDQVFDKFNENVYIIADSNHGYKMIGVGKLVAEEVLGEKSKLLEPFRFSRFVEGKLHPTSNSPFPWS